MLKTPIINVNMSPLCLTCNGHCCSTIRLNHSLTWKNTYSNRRMLKRNLKKFGFIKNKDGSHRCSHYHPENAPESCDTWLMRPQMCKNYLCEEALKLKVS